MPSQKISGVNTKKYRRLKVNNNISGGASGISSYEVSSMLNTIKNDPRLQSGNGISPDLVSNLIEAITTLLSNIANNTAPIEKIYQALSTYMTNTTVPTGGGSGVSDNGGAKVVRTKAPTYSASHNNVSPSMEIDASIKNLVGTLAQLAKG
jgi:hypothetical protein